MNCEDAQYLIHAYVDGELDLVHGLEIEKHVEACSQCSWEMAEIKRLKADMEDLYRRAPSGLDARVRRSVRQSASPGGLSNRLPVRALAVAAVVAAVLILGWLFARMAPFRARQAPIEGEVIASHVRSLMQPGHLVDVPSSDQHTVKPWFNGKLDFSPEVVDLTDSGFPLEGGRLDYIDGRAVAALVYGRNKHRINVFIWPSPDGNSSSRTSISRDGYNLIHWTAEGFNYWMVSDLNQSELSHLADLLSRPAH